MSLSERSSAEAYVLSEVHGSALAGLLAYDLAPWNNICIYIYIHMCVCVYIYICMIVCVYIYVSSIGSWMYPSSMVNR